MNPESTTDLDATAEGRAFADCQTLMAQPSGRKQFRQHVAFTAGSAFALALYTEEHIRERHRHPSLSQKEQEQETGPAQMLPGLRRLADNTRLLRDSAMDVQNALQRLAKLPFSRSVTGREIPRIIGVAHSLLSGSKFCWSLETLADFVRGYQESEPLHVRELWALPIALKQVLLEEILTQAPGAWNNVAASDAALDTTLLSLHEMGLTTWADVLEPLIPFEPLLAEDPAGAYSKMDFESRDLYRTVIERTAARSDKSEVEVAQIAMAMAWEASRQNNANPRVTARQAHVGYYLVDAGLKELRLRCGFRPGPLDRLRSLLRGHPDNFYLGGIETVAFLAMAAVILPLVPLYNPLGRLGVAFLLLLLPVSQFAVELMHHTVNAILKPYPLPKLDFSRGIPEDAKTLVAVPTLLMNERQVRELVEELEVRSLANQDPNIHYALLTDLPDSTEKPSAGDNHPLVLLAGELIEGLNRRYADTRGGGFLMLHRHRIFNPRQGVWMGWERKRGKLLDLNRLVMGGMDCFPYKAGDTSVLKDMRYVLTLDSDTRLQRESVHRMVGAIAHPLNRAILDERRRIVTEGYGLLQPTVGVAVRSTARSRLAAIYSGQTGFDIYTRAISDVYQDLYGAGSFTGKGLYEIAILHTVLDRRFPQNSLLSHDLIEGAYGRVGLLTDVEVMDDYPSHYSAQNRRKHRWVRGDWQVLRWLLDRVPDDTGHLVRNPTSTISRWKIFDNLRRSLVEPATLFLLVAGWLWLPGTPRYWTIATLLIVFVPVLIQLIFSLARASVGERPGRIRQAVRDSAGNLLITALNFVFLAHQALLMFDAIVRSLVRSFVTGNRLLEWETAAESELEGGKKTPVETTLRLTPFLSLVLALLVSWVRPSALPWALPILVLWALAKPITRWLNRPSSDPEIELSEGDTQFLRGIGWRTWRYFAHFPNRQNHGIAPDNVQREPDAQGEDFREAMRFSPTNAGLQLNARQAAVVLGYLTLPEYAEQTLSNLRVLDQIPKWKGHLLNWYSTETLEPIAPYIVSTVDSGNFLASLCSLRMGTLEMLRTPMLPALRQGLLDAVRDMETPSPFGEKLKAALEAKPKQDPSAWLQALLTLDPGASSERAPQAAERFDAIHRLVRQYLPWLLPKFAAEARAAMSPSDRLLAFDAPEAALALCRKLRASFENVSRVSAEETPEPESELTATLISAEERLSGLIADLHRIAQVSDRMLQATEFHALLDPQRRLLAIGYDTSKDRRVDSCYDLLASEARTAMFLAIGKGDVLQDTWFKAGRKTALVDGNPVLLSWSGTMFEYLMPTLWMQTSPDTLLAQSLQVAVRAQRKFNAGARMPWGISEAGHCQRDAAGNYQYRAFGVPALALEPQAEDMLVIAPYAGALALEVDPIHAIENLRRMKNLEWLGEFGFYESADFSVNRQPQDGSRYVLVQSWMAHHQGMSLLAIANLVTGKPFQRWFHSDTRVRATELLLHEKPIQTIPPERLPEAAEIVFDPVPIRENKSA